MKPDEFLDRCKKGLWHVAPAGSWERIRRDGLRTAAQLIDAADLDDANRLRLHEEPREKPVTLSIAGEEVLLRDQAPLATRNDVESILGDGLTVADWVRTLNSRIFVFGDRAGVDKFLVKNGPQDVLTISPLRLLEAAQWSIELSNQNTGAIQQKSGIQKDRSTFQSITMFRASRMAEVTVVDGLPDASVVVRAVRHHPDGTIEELPLKA